MKIEHVAYSGHRHKSAPRPMVSTKRLLMAIGVLAAGNTLLQSASRHSQLGPTPQIADPDAMRHPQLRQPHQRQSHQQNAHLRQSHAHPKHDTAHQTDSDNKQPPFRGTVWASSEIYRPDDPSQYVGIKYKGRSDQVMERFLGAQPNTDWRVETVKNVHCFELQVSPQQSLRVHVDPDFGTLAAARAEVERYGKIIGQMPSFMRKGVQQIDIHNKGNHTFSANGHRHTVLIYKEANDRMFGEKSYPHLEEATFHELTHAAIEADHIHTPQYKQAMESDGAALSHYAAENPQQEDLSESLLMIYAALHRPDRLTSQQKATVEQTIPHRIAYAKAHIIKHPHLRAGDV